MTYAELSKALVMEAIRRLVDEELAEWERSDEGELKLHLASGECFILCDRGIRHECR